METREDRRTGVEEEEDEEEEEEDEAGGGATSLGAPLACPIQY